MFVCITVLYEYMNLPNVLRNDVYNLFVNRHVRIKIYRKLYHDIIYIANEGRHVRIFYYFSYLFYIEKCFYIQKSVFLYREVYFYLEKYVFIQRKMFLYKERCFYIVNGVFIQKSVFLFREVYFYIINFQPISAMHSFHHMSKYEHS